MNIKYHNTPSQLCDNITEAATITTLAPTDNLSNTIQVLLLALVIAISPDLSEYARGIMRLVNLTNGDGSGTIPLVGVGT